LNVGGKIQSNSFQQKKTNRQKPWQQLRAQTKCQGKTKFMLEANPRQQPSEMKTIPVTAIGKRILSLARILYTRQQSLSGVGNCHWHAKKILGTSLCGVGKQSLLAWHQESVESWQSRQSSLARRGSLVAQGKVCGFQAGCGRSGNFKRAKRTRYSFFSLQE